MVKLLVSRKKALKMIEESAEKATFQDFVNFAKLQKHAKAKDLSRHKKRHD